jgi:putative FmdB family regulatory protein
MPTYEYACKSCGEHLEVVQSFTDDALTECPSCAGPLRKVFGNVGIAFKGSGFYRNDSRSDGAKSSALAAKASDPKSSEGASGKDGPSKEGSSGKEGSAAASTGGKDGSSSSPAPSSSGSTSSGSSSSGSGSGSKVAAAS